MGWKGYLAFLPILLLGLILLTHPRMWKSGWSLRSKRFMGLFLIVFAVIFGWRTAHIVQPIHKPRPLQQIPDIDLLVDGTTFPASQPEPVSSTRPVTLPTSRQH